MSCIWNIPKQERHCEYCLARCGKREVQSSTSTTDTSTIVPIPNNTIVIGETDYFLIDGKLVERTI